jgi:hypothetical protein
LRDVFIGRIVATSGPRGNQRDRQLWISFRDLERRTYDAHVLDRLGGREKVIGILTASVVIGICVWIVSQIALYLFIYSGSLPSLSIEGWVKWAQILSQVSYAVWLGALALLLLLWLRDRLVGSALPPSGRD